MGFQTPDYTAYEDYFRAHHDRLDPVRLEAREENGFLVTPDDVAAADLDAFVISNPNNPTGQALEGDTLKQLVDDARRPRTLLILDEFYSHFAFAAEGGPAPGPISGAAAIDNVDTDPVLIVDGLTKSFRYPGWRVGWVLGPPPIIETLHRVASALDGGPSIPAQRAALTVLEPDRADQETQAVRAAFARKRDTMVAGLREMGVRLPAAPTSTFYAWGDLSGLPPRCRTPMRFSRRLGRQGHDRAGPVLRCGPDALQQRRLPFPQVDAILIWPFSRPGRGRTRSPHAHGGRSPLRVGAQSVMAPQGVVPAMPRAAPASRTPFGAETP